MRWLKFVMPLARPAIRIWFRMVRGMTLGVRGLVVDTEGKVLLIRHTYMPGWYMPGGGIERGETAEEALYREMMEEAGVKITGRARLVSFHSNHANHPGDHVLIYRIEQWEACAATQVGEIEALGWFAMNALPNDITPATRRRLAEALEGEEAHPHW